MRKMRKGFTLVELLIVIAILGTLSAAMSVSVMGSTAKAKAAAIASNVEACVTAAAMYCADNMDADISSVTTEAVLSAYIGKWGDFGDENSVKYEVADITPAEGATLAKPKTWCIKVTIVDSDKASIIAELEKIRGFGKFGATGENAKSVVATNSDGSFYVRLWNGKVTATAPSA